MKRIGLTLLFCLLTLAGCSNDAERSNPLDPKSDNFDVNGSLSGRVLRLYPPFVPISNAEIRLEPGPIVAMTDNSGNFELLDLEPGPYKISATKTGYAVDTDSVEISTQQLLNIDFNLDGLPVVSDFNITTGRISRWFPINDLLSLQITATVTDPDGVSDIDFLELFIPQLDFRERLVEIAPGNFSKQYLETNLPKSNLFDLIGHDSQLVATDNAGYSSEPLAKQIVRIIDEVPVAVSPVSLQRLSDSRPNLIWQSTTLPFKFNYRLDLFRDDSGITTTIESQLSLPTEQNSTQVNSILTTGRYFWTISVVDEFGNTSRSKPAAFEIN